MLRLGKGIIPAIQNLFYEVHKRFFGAERSIRLRLIKLPDQISGQIDIRNKKVRGKDFCKNQRLTEFFGRSFAELLNIVLNAAFKRDDTDGREQGACSERLSDMFLDICKIRKEGEHHLAYGLLITD